VTPATQPALSPQTATVLPTTSSPAAAAELPRTGAAGLKDEALFGLFLLLAGLAARTAGRRARNTAV
jgi:hypothetical protein